MRFGLISSEDDSSESKTTRFVNEAGIFWPLRYEAAKSTAFPILFSDELFFWSKNILES
jgi:hypothetical protein